MKLFDAVRIACALALGFGSGCTAEGALRASTVEASQALLGAASEAGYPTRIVALGEPLDADEALAPHRPLDPETTYLVLTQTDAKVVWGSALEGEPPVPERMLLARWVVPYLRTNELDSGLKAFVFGYLEALASAGRINRTEGIIPFDPPGSPRDTDRSWGVFLALAIMLVVGWLDARQALTRGSRAHASAPRRPRR